MRSQLGVYAASDEFCDRHAEPSRAPLHLSMLCWLKLYLNTHHDGVIIPSYGSHR